MINKAHGQTDHHGELGHIVPVKVYATVLAVLLTLTVITVIASRIDFGVFNIVVAMVIASLKAGIVALYFMHLKYENPVTWIYVAFPLVLLFVMIGGIFVDNPTRLDPKIYFEGGSHSGGASADTSAASGANHH